METNHIDRINPEVSHPEHYDLIKERDLHIDKNASGVDILEERRDSRHHHQEFGNRKYESDQNRPSAAAGQR